MTEKELLTEVKKRVQSMAVEPPWCANMNLLRKWIEGFETCQQYAIYAIESMITERNNKSEGG